MEGFNDSKKRVDIIISKLRENDLPQDIYEAICGWLLSGDSLAEKEERLSRLFDEIFSEEKKSGRSGKRALEMYYEFLERTGGNRAAVRKVPLLRRTAFRIAAVLIPIVFLAGAAIWLCTTRTDDKLITAGAYGCDVKEVLLPDGSKVRLRRGGIIEYPADFIDNRHVRLVGEAKFFVAKRESPFTVSAESIDVTVLGTVFSVAASPASEETAISLFSGSVEIECENREKITLSPLEKLIYSASDHKAQIELFDPSVETKAYSRKLHLDGVGLKEAFAKIGTFKGVDISVEPGFSAGNIVKATFYEEDSAEQMVSLIQQLTGSFDYTVEGEREGGSILISSKK